MGSVPDKQSPPGSRVRARKPQRAARLLELAPQSSGLGAGEGYCRERIGRPVCRAVDRTLQCEFFRPAVSFGVLVPAIFSFAFPRGGPPFQSCRSGTGEIAYATDPALRDDSRSRNICAGIADQVGDSDAAGGVGALA